MAVRNRVCGPTQCGTTVVTTRCTKGGCKPDVGRCMPGASLSRRRPGKAPLGKPALQPYWGKPAVRNDRGDRGNVGIIRSPVRASILPDYMVIFDIAADRACQLMSAWRQKRPPGKSDKRKALLFFARELTCAWP